MGKNKDESNENNEGKTDPKVKVKVSPKTRKIIAGVVMVVGTIASIAVGGPWASAILFGAETAAEAIKTGGGKEGKTGKVGKAGKAEVEVVAVAQDCNAAKNTCPDYSIYWMESCPEGARCLQFKNSCADLVNLTYEVGCNGDGSAGAPQCSCTAGPVLAVGGSAFFEILDADYTSCLPSWKPACLTAGLAVVAGKAVIAADGAPAGAPSCQGTRVEFTAGNKADPYGKFDSYDVDLEKGYTIPVSFTPDLTCAHDHANHDCRPLWCDSATCPDAYLTPTSGGCPDGRSPQAGCQDTFNDPKGFVIEFCPASGESCQDAEACGT